MKRLTVVAPAEPVAQLRELAKAQRTDIYKDRSILRFKYGKVEPVLERAQAILPEGSFEIYRAYYSGKFNRPSHTPLQPNAIRIKVK